MLISKRFRPIIWLAVMVLGTRPAPGQRLMEHLTRGLMAVKRNDGAVYMGWWWLNTDPERRLSTCTAGWVPSFPKKP